MASYYRPSILGHIPRAGHAVIEASAGTGKTYTIENLMLDLILRSECTIDQILVVTFTEKATAELRGRIRALLEATLSGHSRRSVDSEERALNSDDLHRLEEALFSFDRASIFTIHGFCQRVLSDLAFESGSRFALEVVDGRNALRRAFRAELREHLAVETGAKALLEKYLGESDSSDRNAVVEALEGLLWEAHAQRYLRSGQRERNIEALDAFARKFDPSILEKAYARLSANVKARAKTALARLSQERKRAGRSAEAISAAIDVAAFDGIPSIDKIEKAHKGAKLPQAAVEMQQILERCAGALTLESKILDCFLPRVEERLTNHKRERGEIDYDDMLLSVWTALESERGATLAAALRSRFRFALLDEFQDTDYLQWDIFRRIFLDRGSQSRMFLVGDPKQAIYAFRGADVYAYLAARAELAESHGVNAVPLVQNFRSTAALIEGLNLILDDAAASPLLSGDTRYKHPVRCGRPDLRALDSSGKPVTPVTLMRFRAAGKLKIPSARAAVGRHIARTIRAMIDSERGRITIRDEGQDPRLVEANNIFVLTRSGAESAEIGEYLREEGVPFAFYKQEGLFQTPEAYDVADLLRAIEQPAARSRQLKAWASPFFAIGLRDLFSMGELPGDHPLLERLWTWHGMAEEERFPELFDSILHQSGLANRELFLSNSERELTNYQHILETLLVCTLEERLSLAEIIERLEGYIQQTASPPGMNGNLQRIESERRAVQIMSIHMSKGLEADVVFLFGGMYRVNNRARICVYHDESGKRRVIASSVLKHPLAAQVKSQFDREQDDEQQRLTYVALTRARARLYLPFFVSDDISGYYRWLNRRLTAMLDSEARKQPPGSLFQIEDVPYSRPGVSTAAPKSTLKSWSPPQRLLAEDRDAAERDRELDRKAHRAMVVRSYTSLSRKAAHAPEVEEFKEDVSESQPADLAGGRSVGIFLHEVIEKLDFSTLADPIELGRWRDIARVKELFERTMRRHGVADEKWFEAGSEMIFNLLRSPISLGNGTRVGPLYSMRSYQREMEFVYPIPEPAHSLLGAQGGENWRAERGYLKGFVDFVFEQDRLTYFADWKSDNLDGYDPASIEAQVKDHYEMQAKIYSVGVVRLLGIRGRADYDARFGGLMYAFLRAMRTGAPAGHGIYFHRPQWEEIVAYEESLMRIPTGAGAAA